MQSQLPEANSDFETAGFSIFPAVVGQDMVERLIEAIEPLRVSSKRAGLRHLLKRSAVVRSFANGEDLLKIVRAYLGDDARPIKAVLFDKTPVSNWYVTWHQDLSIAVGERIETEGFGPWSMKDGELPVQPPARVLENIVSMRVHLDDCLVENGAIKFIAGSHRYGILEASEIAAWREGNKATTCPARKGDVIIMRPLVLHSSSVSGSPEHRRVLHIEYSGSALSDGLSFAEV